MDCRRSDACDGSQNSLADTDKADRLKLSERGLVVIWRAKKPVDIGSERGKKGKCNCTSKWSPKDAKSWHWQGTDIQTGPPELFVHASKPPGLRQVCVRLASKVGMP